MKIWCCFCFGEDQDSVGGMTNPSDEASDNSRLGFRLGSYGRERGDFEEGKVGDALPTWEAMVGVGSSSGVRAVEGLGFYEESSMTSENLEFDGASYNKRAKFYTDIL